MKEFLNKKILITGATGSFGNKFIDILIEKKVNFKSLIVYSRDEFKHSGEPDCIACFHFVKK